MELTFQIAADANLLDSVDPAFGWVGVCHLIDAPWRYTAGEVSEKIEDVWAARL